MMNTEAVSFLISKNTTLASLPARKHRDDDHHDDDDSPFIFDDTATP